MAPQTSSQTPPEVFAQASLPGSQRVPRLVIVMESPLLSPWPTPSAIAHVSLQEHPLVLLQTKPLLYQLASPQGNAQESPATLQAPPWSIARMLREAYLLSSQTFSPRVSAWPRSPNYEASGSKPALLAAAALAFLAMAWVASGCPHEKWYHLAEK